MMVRDVPQEQSNLGMSSSDYLDAIKSKRSVDMQETLEKDWSVIHLVKTAKWVGDT